MKTTRIKTSPVNQGQKSSKKEQVRKTMQDIGDKTPVKDKLVGGSGAFGVIGGSGVKVAKGAFKTIKNLLTRGSKPKNVGGFREFANPKLRNHFNPTSKRTTSLPNPIPNSTKAYNKLQYPMGKKAFSQTPKSKPAKSTGTFREIANESLRRGLNKGDKINPTY